MFLVAFFACVFCGEYLYIWLTHYVRAICIILRYLCGLIYAINIVRENEQTSA